MSDLSRGGDASLSAGATPVNVRDASGNTAAIVSMHAGDDGAQQALVQLEDGTRVMVPVALLAQQSDGGYLLPFTLQGPSEQMRIPVIEEAITVGKRRVETGRGVRVHKHVEQREETIDQPLMRDELVVEHVPVGRLVKEDEVPHTRYEGDTMVLPVFEEVLVVQKQLMLKEEVRITRRQHEVHAPQKVVLRSEQVKVERFE